MNESRFRRDIALRIDLNTPLLAEEERLDRFRDEYYQEEKPERQQQIEDDQAPIDEETPVQQTAAQSPASEDEFINVRDYGSPSSASSSYYEEPVYKERTDYMPAREQEDESPAVIGGNRVGGLANGESYLDAFDVVDTSRAYVRPRKAARKESTPEIGGYRVGGLEEGQSYLDVYQAPPQEGKNGRHSSTWIEKDAGKQDIKARPGKGLDLRPAVTGILQPRLSARARADFARMRMKRQRPEQSVHTDISVLGAYGVKATAAEALLNNPVLSPSGNNQDFRMIRARIKNAGFSIQAAAGKKRTEISGIPVQDARGGPGYINHALVQSVVRKGKAAAHASGLRTGLAGVSAGTVEDLIQADTAAGLLRFSHAVIRMRPGVHARYGVSVGQSPYASAMDVRFSGTMYAPNKLHFRKGPAVRPQYVETGIIRGQFGGTAPAVAVPGVKNGELEFFDEGYHATPAAINRRPGKKGPAYTIGAYDSNAYMLEPQPDEKAEADALYQRNLETRLLQGIGGIHENAGQPDIKNKARTAPAGTPFFRAALTKAWTESSKKELGKEPDEASRPHIAAGGRPIDTLKMGTRIAAMLAANSSAFMLSKMAHVRGVTSGRPEMRGHVADSGGKRAPYQKRHSENPYEADAEKTHQLQEEGGFREGRASKEKRKRAQRHHRRKLPVRVTAGVLAAAIAFLTLFGSNYSDYVFVYLLPAMSDVVFDSTGTNQDTMTQAAYAIMKSRFEAIKENILYGSNYNRGGYVDGVFSTDDVFSGPDVWQGKKYNFTEEELRQIAYQCRYENDSPAGMAYEACQIVNQLELQLADSSFTTNGHRAAGNTDEEKLLDNLRNSGWWASASSNMDQAAGATDLNANNEGFQAVANVLNNGQRVCPLYIDEHDEVWRIEGATGISRNSFVRNQTRFSNNGFGSSYTFWGFPGGDMNYDPFGYTDRAVAAAKNAGWKDAVTMGVGYNGPNTYSALGSGSPSRWGGSGIVYASEANVKAAQEYDYKADDANPGNTDSTDSGAESGSESSPSARGVTEMDTESDSGASSTASGLPSTPTISTADSNANGVLTTEVFLAKMDEVAKWAAVKYAEGNLHYGDSHPGSDGICGDDGKLSCDRIIARALFLLGFNDQPGSPADNRGITVGDMGPWLVEHGWIESRGMRNITRGSIVVVQHYCHTFFDHTFVVVDIDPTTMKMNIYNGGSNSALAGPQPLTNISWCYREGDDEVLVYNLPDSGIAANGLKTDVDGYDGSLNLPQINCSKAVIYDTDGSEHVASRDAVMKGGVKYLAIPKEMTGVVYREAEVVERIKVVGVDPETGETLDGSVVDLSALAEGPAKTETVEEKANAKGTKIEYKDGFVFNGRHLGVTEFSDEEKKAAMIQSMYPERGQIRDTNVDEYKMSAYELVNQVLDPSICYDVINHRHYPEHDMIISRQYAAEVNAEVEEIKRAGLIPVVQYTLGASSRDEDLFYTKLANVSIGEEVRDINVEVQEPEITVKFVSKRRKPDGSVEFWPVEMDQPDLCLYDEAYADVPGLLNKGELRLIDGKIEPSLDEGAAESGNDPAGMSGTSTESRDSSDGTAPSTDTEAGIPDTNEMETFMPNRPYSEDTYFQMLLNALTVGTDNVDTRMGEAATADLIAKGETATSFVHLTLEEEEERVKKIEEQAEKSAEIAGANAERDAEVQADSEKQREKQRKGREKLREEKISQNKDPDARENISDEDFNNYDGDLNGDITEQSFDAIVKMSPDKASPFLAKLGYLQYACDLVDDSFESIKELGYTVEYHIQEEIEGGFTKWMTDQGDTAVSDQKLTATALVTIYVGASPDDLVETAVKADDSEWGIADMMLVQNYYHDDFDEFMDVYCISPLVRINDENGMGPGDARSAFSGVAQQIYVFLHEHGLNNICIAGILGNLAQECGGQKFENIDPCCIQSNGVGYGILQWSGDRRTAFLNYASSKGKPWTDLQVQLEFLWAEVFADSGRTHWYGLYEQFMHAVTPEDAAHYFLVGPEAGGESTYHQYSHWAEDVRKSEAARAYSLMKSGSFFASGNVQYINQGDYSHVPFNRAYSDYGDSASIQTSGCGICSMVMVLNFFGKNVSVEQAAVDGDADPSFNPTQSTETFANFSRKYGIPLPVHTETRAIAEQACAVGGIVVVHVHGHYYVVQGKGKVGPRIFDPGFRDRTEQGQDGNKETWDDISAGTYERKNRSAFEYFVWNAPS